LNSSVYAHQDAILLNQRTNIYINGNKISKEISYKIIINNRSGEENSRVSIIKSGLSQISGIKARLTDIFGKTIKVLKSSEIKKSHLITDAAFFQDNLLYEFELSHYSYPYILEYSYTEKENQFLDIEYWRPVLNYDVETTEASLCLLVPKDYQFNTIVSNIDAPKIDTIENKLQFTWKTRFNPLPEPEKLMPPMSSSYPSLRIIPQHFEFGSNGSFVDWKSYGQWQYETNRKLQYLPEGAENEIKSLINDCKSIKEKVKLLYQKLQDETRYVNISTETGGLIPMPASEVYEKKYGDCKALSNYFCAILSTAGIHAIYTDVYSSEKRMPFNPEIPSQQFNHVIVCVPVENDTLWVDCTADGPLGEVYNSIQGRNVLLIENQNSRLTTIPSLRTDEVLQERLITMQKDSTGRIMADFQNHFRGTESVFLNEIASIQQESKRRKFINQYFSVNQADLIDYQIFNGGRDSDTSSLRLGMKLQEKYQRVGNDELIYFFPFDIPYLQKPGLRKYPVQIDVPEYKKDVQIFRNPGILIHQLQDVSIKTVYGNYFRKVEMCSEGIKLTKELEIHPGKYSLLEYPDFYRFINDVKEAEQFTILINKEKNK